MNEARLYELAHEALLNKWGRENDFLKEHPENEISQIKEKELWNELLILEKWNENQGDLNRGEENPWNTINTIIKRQWT